MGSGPRTHGPHLCHVSAALFRETRAYPLLVKIFARPGEFPFDLAGDVVTQDLASILTSVSGGDPAGMMTLIENEQVNEWVRSQAMDAMAKLVVIGRLGRDETMSYFLQLFRKLEREHSAAWDGLANACADLWPHEALYELNRAYKDGLVNPGSIGWKDIERALALGKDGALEETRRRELLIDDVAREMGWMMCFQERERFDKPENVYKSENNVPEYTPLPAWTGGRITPIRRDKPKIGRNDPCTCGSGKKFKKCCGTNAQSAAIQ